VKQTLFDILSPKIAGSKFLDVCAGSGGVGLEAASRGAARVVLVESSRAALDVIRANAAVVAPAGAEIEVMAEDARSALRSLARRGRRFDLVFLDPPYASDIYETVLEALGTSGLLADGGHVVAEHFHKRALPATIGGLEQFRSVRVGDHLLTFYRRGE
jgi:16S rRNA (guanine966-N2)-methyltransferase